MGDAPNTGIRQYSYDPLTGAVTDQGFLVRASVDNTKPIDPDHGLDLLDVRDFDLDLTTNTLYFTELLTGPIAEMGLYRMDLTTKVITQMVSSTQFPDRAPTATSSTSRSIRPPTSSTSRPSRRRRSAPPDYNAATQCHLVRRGERHQRNSDTAHAHGLPGRRAPLSRRHGLRSEHAPNSTSNPKKTTAGSADDVIYVFQLDAEGNSANLVQTITPTPAFTGTGANFGGMAFDILAEIATLEPRPRRTRSSRSPQLDLLTAAPTITDVDGDHLNNATVTISGSFVGSGDDLYVLDGGHAPTSGLIYRHRTSRSRARPTAAATRS